MTEPITGAPSLSVVIPVLNGMPFLAEQLSAIATESVRGGFEVVIADNGSTDGTVAFAESLAASMDLRVVRAERKGVSCARNTGVWHSRAPKVVFLDSDDQIAPGYLQAMSNALATHDIVAARIDAISLNPNGCPRDIAQTVGIGQGWLPWGYGATLGLSRDLYLRIGGCDEDLRFAGDDIDLCWRAQMAGATLGFVTDAVLRYRVRTDGRSLFRQGRSYGRGGAQVDRRFRPFGAIAPSPYRQLRMTAAAAFHLALPRSAIDRSRAAFLLGRRLGYLQGVMRREQVRGVGRDGVLLADDQPC